MYLRTACIKGKSMNTRRMTPLCDHTKHMVDIVASGPHVRGGFLEELLILRQNAQESLADWSCNTFLRISIIKILVIFAHYS